MSPKTLSTFSRDDQIALVRRLYLETKFQGSFSGIKVMKREIFLKTNMHVPVNVIAEALRSIPTYLMHMKPVRKYPVAQYDVSTIGEVVQGRKKLN
jgi:hypothetical protein